MSYITEVTWAMKYVLGLYWHAQRLFPISISTWTIIHLCDRMNITNRPITTKSFNGSRSRFLFEKLNERSFKWRLKTQVNFLTDRLGRNKPWIVAHSNPSSNSMIASNRQTICKIPKIFNFKFSWTLAVVLYQTAKLSAVFFIVLCVKNDKQRWKYFISI